MKKLLYMLTAAALITSCTKTEIYEMPDGEGQGATIQAKSTHNGVTAAVTRKPFEGNITSGNQLTAQILTFRADKTLWSDGTMTFADAATTAVPYNSGATKLKFGAMDTETYSMYGFYPAASPTWTYAGTDTDDATMTITFDGNDDVMFASAITTTPVAQKAGTYNPLTFDHQLTKLIIKINAKDAESGTEWGELQNIVVKKLAGSAANLTPELTCALKDGVVTFGGTPTDFNFYLYDGTTYSDALYTTDLAEIEFDTDDTTFATVAYTMVAPFNKVASGDVELAVTAETTNGPRTVTVPVTFSNPATGTSTKGYAYDIKLTFDMTGIKAQATVTPWTPGGEGNHTID